MFIPKRFKRQRRTAGTGSRRASSGLRRQLRVEAMESRLMLSNNAPGDEPPTWQEIPVSGNVVELVQVAAPIFKLNVQQEGGFINNGYSPIDYDVLTADFQMSSQFSSLSTGQEVGNLLMQDRSAFTVNAAGGMGGWAIINSQSFTEDASRYLIYRGVDGDISLNDAPLANGILHDSATFAEHEGGVIPVEPLLKLIGPGIVPTSVAKTNIKSLTGSEAGGSLATFAGKSSLHEISGEWARAAVFEIAGGEPVSGGLSENELSGKSQATLDDSATARDRESLTSTDESDVTGRLASHDAPADRNTEQPIPGDATAAAAKNRGSNAMPTEVAVDGSMRPSTVANILSNRVFGASEVAKASSRADGDPQSDAAAAAFDQIGASEVALSSPFSLDSTLRRSIGLMPLLLMLALERVAPRNWSRHWSRDDTKARRAPQVP